MEEGPMIDAKTAVQFAKQHAVNMLGDVKNRLEEIELDSYKGRDVWRVTLGIANMESPSGGIPALMRGFGLAVDYKLFLVDAETGDLVAMKMREPAVQ
jgi:hypothetical protein